MTSGLVVIAFLSSAIFIVGKQLAGILIFSLILSFFLITYGIFVYSSGAILPAYFDLVSRVLYKHRAIFFAANLTTGSLAGFLVKRNVDFIIK